MELQGPLLGSGPADVERMNQQFIQNAVANVMPRALATGLLRSFCTIQAPAVNPNADGTPSTTYTNVPGLVNIVCMDAPPSLMNIQANEVKTVAEILAKGMRHVLLGQCFTDAINWAGYGYQAVVDGVEFDILGAENDSQSTQTRLELQLSTV